MEVIFERLEGHRYAITVRRDGGPTLRMDPAPGFDPYLPHDLQHLIVEEQLGLRHGIFGRLAEGGTASTFRLVDDSDGGRTARERGRRQRRLSRRDARLSTEEESQFGASERATFVVWCDWLAHCPEPELRLAAERMADSAASIVARMPPAERTLLMGALPRIRERVDVLARRWNALPPGGSLSIIWEPVGAPPRRAPT